MLRTVYSSLKDFSVNIIVHLPFPTRYYIVSGFPLLKRACPTADTRQNAKRAGSHAGGRGGVLRSIKFHYTSNNMVLRNFSY
jgi:hypothetical protein